MLQSQFLNSSQVPSSAQPERISQTSDDLVSSNLNKLTWILYLYVNSYSAPRLKTTLTLSDE